MSLFILLSFSISVNTAFAGRYYDAEIARFATPDPAALEYPSLNPFSYSGNNPIIYIDPDGKRFYFAAGAGHDPDNTGYIQMMLRTFEAAGIKNTVDINAHGSKPSDISFTTGSYREQYHQDMRIQPTARQRVAGFTELTKKTDWRIVEAVSQINDNLAEMPLESGEQLNIAGYSTGSVIAAQSALDIANSGQTVDHVILIGSPITENSDLYNSLVSNENIKNVIRVDIRGDNVQNIGLETLLSFILEGESHPHFKYAYGKKAEENTQELAKELKDQGVQ